MLADADLASIGRALGDAHRARFVLALLGGEELPAGELAARAGTSSSLTSAHLARLLESGLVTARGAGPPAVLQDRQRADRRVHRGAAGDRPAPDAVGLTEVTRGKALQRARTCYDHLAGQLGVALVDSFERDRMLLPTASGWDLTSTGERKLARLGLDAAALHEGRRPFLRPCLDWTERRPHLAGMLGQALAGHLLDLDWVRRSSQSRALVITPSGERQLLAEFAIKL